MSITTFRISQRFVTNKVALNYSKQGALQEANLRSQTFLKERLTKRLDG